MVYGSSGCCDAWASGCGANVEKHVSKQSLALRHTSHSSRLRCFGSQMESRLRAPMAGRWQGDTNGRQKESARNRTRSNAAA